MNERWQSAKCPNKGVLKVSGDLFLCAQCVERCEQWRDQQCPVEKNITIAEMTPCTKVKSTVNCINDVFIDYGAHNHFAGFCVDFDLKPEYDQDKKNIAFWKGTTENWGRILLENRDYLAAIYSHCHTGLVQQKQEIFGGFDSDVWTKLLQHNPDFYSEYSKFKTTKAELSKQQWFFVCCEQPQLIYAALEAGVAFTLLQVVAFISRYPDFDDKFYAKIINLIKEQPLEKRGPLWCCLMCGGADCCSADQDDTKIAPLSLLRHQAFLNGVYNEKNWNSCNLNELTGADWRTILSKQNLTEHAIAVLKEKKLTDAFTDDDWAQVAAWKNYLDHPSVMHFHKFYKNAPKSARIAHAKTLSLVLPVFVFATLVILMLLTGNQSFLRVANIPFFYCLGLCGAGLTFASLRVTNKGMFLNAALVAGTGVFAVPGVVLTLSVLLNDNMDLQVANWISFATFFVLIALPLLVIKKFKKIVYVIIAMFWLASGYFIFMDGARSLNQNAYLYIAKQAEAWSLNGSKAYFLKKHLRLTKFKQRWENACESEDTETLNALFDEWVPTADFGVTSYQAYLTDFIDAWLDSSNEDQRKEFENLYACHFEGDELAHKILSETLLQKTHEKLIFGSCEYVRIYRHKLHRPVKCPQEVYQHYIKNLLNACFNSKNGFPAGLWEHYKYDDQDAFRKFVVEAKTPADFLKYATQYRKIYRSVDASIYEKGIDFLKKGKSSSESFCELFAFCAEEKKNSETLKEIAMRFKAEKDLPFEMLREIHKVFPIDSDFMKEWLEMDDYKNYLKYKDYDFNVFDPLTGVSIQRVLEEIKNAYQKKILSLKYKDALEKLSGKEKNFKPMLAFYDEVSNFHFNLEDYAPDCYFWMGYAHYLNDDKKKAAKVWQSCFEQILGWQMFSRVDNEAIHSLISNSDILDVFADGLANNNKLSEAEAVWKYSLEDAKKSKASKEKIKIYYQCLIEKIDKIKYFVAAVNDEECPKDFLKDIYVANLDIASADHELLSAFLKLYEGNSKGLFEKLQDKMDDLREAAQKAKHTEMLKKLCVHYMNKEEWSLARELLEKIGFDSPEDKESFITDSCEQPADAFYKLSSNQVDIDQLHKKYLTSLSPENGEFDETMYVECDYCMQKAYEQKSPEAIYIYSANAVYRYFTTDTITGTDIVTAQKNLISLLDENIQAISSGNIAEKLKELRQNIK